MRTTSWRPLSLLACAGLALSSPALAQSGAAPGGKPVPKLVLFMVIDGFPQEQLVKYYDQYGRSTPAPLPST